MNGNDSQSGYESPEKSVKRLSVKKLTAKKVEPIKIMDDPSMDNWLVNLQNGIVPHQETTRFNNGEIVIR